MKQDDVCDDVYIMNMVRKQVYITGEQDARLKKLAAEQGMSEAELVRLALDSLEEVTYSQTETNATGRIREVATMERYEAGHTTAEQYGEAAWQNLDDAAWEAELEFIRSIGAGKEGSADAGAAWKFDRDELYEDRLAKVLRRH